MCVASIFVHSELGEKRSCWGVKSPPPLPVKSIVLEAGINRVKKEIYEKNIYINSLTNVVKTVLHYEQKIPIMYLCPI